MGQIVLQFIKLHFHGLDNNECKSRKIWIHELYNLFHTWGLICNSLWFLYSVQKRDKLRFQIQLRKLAMLLYVNIKSLIWDHLFCISMCLAYWKCKIAFSPYHTIYTISIVKKISFYNLHSYYHLHCKYWLRYQRSKLFCLRLHNTRT